MAFKAAICPSCGGQLQVPDDRDSVKCMYCGSDIIVRQAIQAVSGINIQNYLELAKTAFKNGNHQEAYDYYSKVLEIDIKNPQAWFGKARSAGWLSKLDDFRFPEMITGFQNSIANVSDNDRPKLKRRCAQVIYEVADACYSLSKKHVAEHRRVSGVPQDYLQKCDRILSLLDHGYGFDPSNPFIIKGIITICKDNMEGVYFEEWSEFTKSWSLKVFNLPPDYEKSLKEKIERYSNIMKSLDPSYKAPEIKKKSTCCFVITATMGNKYHPYVITLQNFRDTWLVTKNYGFLLIRLYNKIGPFFASIIRDSPTLKLLCLYAIVKPSVFIASNICENVAIKEEY